MAGRTSGHTWDMEVCNDGTSLVKNSALYKEYLAERDEILRHKWIESEKAGRDIGFERAMLGWLIKHGANWRAHR